MTTTLVLPQWIAEELETACTDTKETAGVLLASPLLSHWGGTRLLGRKLLWVDDSAYVRRETQDLLIRSEGYIHALKEAEELGAVPIWTHTHPKRGVPLPSTHDEVVDAQIQDLFRMRSGSPFYGTLIVSAGTGGMAFSGYLMAETNRKAQFERLWVVGDKFRLDSAYGTASAPSEAIYDRNVLAFGKAIQHTLGDLAIGVVGCGGIGSSVAEQLARLGVRHLTLIDPETLSESNITRVYGSAQRDVGKPKVVVLSKYLKRIAPAAQIVAIQSMITVEATAKRLGFCDVIFGCTDDNAGRLVLSRASTYLLTPVIDCGVLLSSDASGCLTAINGRVTVLTPGQACLVCRGRVDISRAAAELMTPKERVRLEREGYAPALGRTEPAVVSFTTAVAAAAVAELMERLIGYGPSPRPSEVLLRLHEREISTNMCAPLERHYCHLQSGKIGAGATTPFLEQTWHA
jgi:hypothetical protein